VHLRMGGGEVYAPKRALRTRVVHARAALQRRPRPCDWVLAAAPEVLLYCCAVLPLWQCCTAAAAVLCCTAAVAVLEDAGWGLRRVIVQGSAGSGGGRVNVQSS
jgi:hypothetical protein